jgi:nicotinamidase-related amidase
MMALPRRDRTTLVVVDMQERLVAAMPKAGREILLRFAGVAIDAARILGLPIVATEQYPKGLGPTIDAIRARIGDRFAPIEKTVFSCARAPEFRAALGTGDPRDLLLVGVEAHVCVLQTAADLIADGHRVFVPADAVLSRRPLDYDRGLALIERAGGTVGTTELFVFHLLERAGTDEFKQISKLVK